jgi:prolyl 4-hydroxylase
VHFIQDVQEDWPLTLIDNNDKRKKVLLKSGEMVLYESARIPHGRQFPLNGNYFDNLFVHYRSEFRVQ